MRLLLVEDDINLRATLVRSLERRGATVQACARGEDALLAWRHSPPDVVALDLSLPDIDGLDVLARARREGLHTPVLVLTARGTVGDRILGLNTGADDYLPKPFDLDELEARLHALVRRRVNATSHAEEDLSALGEWRCERGSGALYYHGQAVDMPARELSLMGHLMQKPGRAVTKEALFAHVFAGELDVQIEAIEVVVYRLRKRLKDTGVQLVTLRGLGYLLKLGD